MNYICYFTSAEWLKNIDKQETVNADCFTEPGKGDKYGIQICTAHVTLSQVQGKDCHFIEIPITRYQILRGEPFGSDQKKHVRRSETAWEQTMNWLERHGVKHRQAMLAVPKSLRKAEGRALYMTYDKETESYIPTLEEVSQ